MLPDDQIRLVVALVLTVPISYFISKISKPNLLITFTILTTLIAQIYVFQYQCILLWLQQHIVYLICKYANRRKVGIITLIQSFMFLAGVMVRRMYIAYGQDIFDITAVLMMQIFLYVGFAFNYQDGEKIVQPSFQNKIHRNMYTIYKFPTYFQYLGFVFFLPACLVGPVFQYKDYEAYVEKKDNYKNLPSTIPAILKQSKTFFGCLLLFAITSRFPLSYVITDQYANSNFAFQFFYMTVMVFGVRIKYYTAWSLGMMAMNATGITYNGKQTKQNGQQQNKWDRVLVSDLYSFEIDPSVKKKSQAWNMSVQLALKRYIYDRIYQSASHQEQKKRKKIQSLAQIYTFIVSAVWHGFYPGYFFSFFHWMLLLQISQELFRVGRQNEKFRHLKDRLFYIQMIYSNFYIGYFGTCFALMNWEKINKFFLASNYIPVIILYISYILVVKMGILRSKMGKKALKKVESQQNETIQDKK